jgi:hypothetical protein
MEQYDPILRARRNAIARVEDEITTTDKEYDKIVRAIDIFFDCVEDELREHDKISRHAETGMLIVTVDDHDSNS